MRKLSYLVTEIGSHMFIKLCLVIMIAIVSLSAIQFIESYQDYRENTQLLQTTIGEDSSFRLMDTSADLLSNRQLSSIITEASSVLESEPFYFSDTSRFTSRNDTDFFVDDRSSWIDYENYEYMNLHSVFLNQALMEKVNLTVAEGTFFTPTDFSGDTQGILLGYDYQDKYRVGDEVSFYEFVDYDVETELATMQPMNFTVRGFLPEDYEMMNLWQGGTETISMDQQVIFPITQQTKESSGWTIDYQMLGYFFLISPEREQELSYLNLSEAILDIGRRHGMGYLSMLNDRSIYNYHISSYKSNYQAKLVLLGLLLVFSFIQMGVIVFFTYKKRTKVYEVYFTIGSTKKELFVVLLLEYAVLFIVGFALLLIGNRLFLHEEWAFETVLIGSLSYFLIFLCISSITIANRLFKNGAYFRRDT